MTTIRRHSFPVLPVVLALFLCGCEIPVTPTREVTPEPEWVEEPLEVTGVAEKKKPVPERLPLELIPLETESPDRGVFVHVMVSFRSKEYSGKWDGWNYSHRPGAHDPDRRARDGTRDIPAVHYPALGAYDMTDPALVEAHCQMWKMAGIDGAFFDVTFYGDPEPNWTAQAVELYTRYMAYYGLKGAVIFEEKGHWIWNPAAKTREEAVRLTYREMDRWFELMKPVQYRLKGRPFFGLFSYEIDCGEKGLSRMTPEEIRAWKSEFPPEARPLMLTQWFKDKYKGVLDGQYDWIIIEGPRSKDGQISRLMPTADVPRVKARSNAEQIERIAKGQNAVWLGGVWPGFDSRGCWGWNTEPSIIPRQNGQVYHMTWKGLEGLPIDAVQIATWNDWFEGSEIEPSLDHGYTYLEMTREHAAAFKGVQSRSGDLSIPEKIYKLRKAGVSLEEEELLREAGKLIRVGDFERAGAIVKPLTIKH